MVAKGSPDWLPSGWTIQYKVQKTGRKIRFYTNLESGKSFLSKDDVIGYIKSMENKKSLPASRRAKTQSSNSPMQVAVQENEHPEWLPDGWKVEMRTRMSGSHVGSVYKLYVDPVTGNRFYSKPEVFRYLRTLKKKLCTLKERRTSNKTSSRGQVVIEHYKDEDLPPGWIKEIKIKKRADGIRKDPFYIDPKTGFVFRSKKDVLRYLETGEISRHAFKPKEGGDDDLELVNDKISRASTAEEQKLEHSATRPQNFAGKEMSEGSNLELPGDQLPHMRQCGNASTELNDAFVPPAETVQNIVLSQDVVRDSSETNEKNNQMGELLKDEVSESKKTDNVSPDNGPVSTSASMSLPKKALPKAKNSGSNNNIEKVYSDNGPVSTSASASASHQDKALPKAETPESNKMKIGSPDNGQVLTSSSVSLHEKAMPKTENPESNKIEMVSADNSPLSTTVSKLQQENTMIDHMMERGDIKDSERKLRKVKKKDINFPRRSSKRLAGLEPELVPNAEKREVPPQVLNINCSTGFSPDTGLSLNANADRVCQQLDVRPVKDIEDNVSNFTDIPLRGDPSNKRKAPLECSIDTPKEQKQRVQTKKMDDGKSEGQLCIPIPEFWSDPCLEFAIKTLTGAFPVESATTINSPISNPTVDSLQGKSLVKKGSDSCIGKKIQVNKKFKNKKEPTLKRRSPSINSLKPQLASDVMSCEQANLYSNNAVLTLNLANSGMHREPPYKNEQFKTSWETEPFREPMPVYQSPPDLNTEQSNKTNECHENQMVPEDQPQKLQAKDHVTSESPFSFPFGDSWSDPCLDFAFKTLTGAIPIEDSLGIQSFFEQRLESSRNQKDGSPALPDFGSPSFFQSDISSHFDGPEKSVSGQHLTSDPFLPGNVSLPSCSGFTSQQSCLDRNRSFKGR